MGPGSAEQREERCAASGTRRFSGSAFPGCAPRRTLRRGAPLIRGPSIQVRMGPGSAEQREERCAASGTRRFSGCCVPRMLRSAPRFAAWCAADPGSIYLNPNGSRHSPGRRVERRSLTCDPSRCGTSLWLTDLTRRANHIGNYRPLCPVPFAKIFCFSENANQPISPPSCSTQRGVSRTSRTRGGVRWTWRRA